MNRAREQSTVVRNPAVSTRQGPTILTAPVHLTLVPGRIFSLLMGVTLTLTIVSFAADALTHVIWAEVDFRGRDQLLGLLSKFNVDDEATIPAWYASFLLLSCAGVLALIGRSQHRDAYRHRRHWRGLAVVFLLLAVDEVAALHDRFTYLLQQPLQATSGPFYYTWIIPGMMFAAVVAMLSVPLLRDLPAPIRWLVLLAGALYVGGAIGGDLVHGTFFEATDGYDMVRAAFYTVEEFLEMTGVTLFLYALLTYLALISQGGATVSRRHL